MLPSKKLALLDLLASKPSNPVSRNNAGRYDECVNFNIIYTQFIDKLHIIC